MHFLSKYKLMLTFLDNTIATKKNLAQFSTLPSEVSFEVNLHSSAVLFNPPLVVLVPTSELAD